ncbi:MAG: hypothetical protein PUK66_07185 [Bacteroidales bacterium]|uniref:hypothetical protein n=1 Tax=Porphyromonas sp. TaxID=1924944 RepID=UPI0029796C74|nr:hypothetical protein [Porphyromonas sp.]MDD7438595.1 hypothetical protein [Bacteroidales bacterium]MDY3067851.1 hypothetical protein [Porphyromonas sp.]
MRTKTQQDRYDYMLHLWNVNRPHYTSTVCLEIVCSRLKMDACRVKAALEDAGVYY